MRPDPSTMSDCHLLDEYLTVYRDGGRRHALIRAQLESRLAACDALRARIAKLEQEPPMAMIDFGVGLDLQGIRDDLQFLDDVRKQNQELRAEVERLRAERDAARAEAERLKDDAARWHNLLPVYEDAEQEVKQLRADLREAMELLQAHGQPPDWLKLGDAADWNTRYGKLLAKHKEAADG